MSSAASLKLYERQQKRKDSSASFMGTDPAYASTSARALGQGRTSVSSSRGGSADRPPATHVNGRERDPLARSRASDAGSVRSEGSYYGSEPRFDAYGREAGIDTSFASASRLTAQARRSNHDLPQSSHYRAVDVSSILSDHAQNGGKQSASPLDPLVGRSSRREMPSTTPGSRSMNGSSSVRGATGMSEFGTAGNGTTTPYSRISTSVPIDSSRRTSDPYGREQDSFSSTASRSFNPATARPSDPRNFAAWSRAALEARVETLEKLLAEKEVPESRSVGVGGGDERELSEHLQVTVRKNRELRAELEVTKNKLATLLEEREAFALKLARDNDSLQSLLEEAQRSKDALGNCIKTLSMEKNELANRLAMAEEEIARLKFAAGSSQAMVHLEEVRGNIEDVSVINEGLRESLRQMQLKNPGYMAGIDLGGDS